MGNKSSKLKLVYVILTYVGALLYYLPNLRMWLTDISFSIKFADALMLPVMILILPITVINFYILERYKPVAGAIRGFLSFIGGYIFAALYGFFIMPSGPYQDNLAFIDRLFDPATALGPIVILVALVFVDLFVSRKLLK